MTKREIISAISSKYYVERDKRGRIKRWVARSISQRRDRLKRAVTKVKSGYGHRGDRR